MSIVHITRLITSTTITFSAVSPDAERLMRDVYGAPTKVFALPVDRQAIIEFHAWAIATGLGLAEDISDPRGAL